MVVMAMQQADLLELVVEAEVLGDLEVLVLETQQK